jgi:hypothetical protein
LLHLEKNKEGLKVDIPGIGIVYRQVRLEFVVGDIKVQNPMSCHYGEFSANTKIILPVCDFSAAQADILERQYIPTNKNEMDEIIDRCSATIKRAQHGKVKNAIEELTYVSKMGVVSVFREFTFVNNPMGIYGSLPFQTLHALFIGLMEYMLKGIFSNGVPPRKVDLWCEKRYSSNMRGKISHRPAKHNFTESMVKEDQSEFTRIIKIAKEIATSHSDCYVPKTPFNNGVTSLTCFSGQ